jgi:hypothetical protein
MWNRMRKYLAGFYQSIDLRHFPSTCPRISLPMQLLNQQFGGLKVGSFLLLLGLYSMICVEQMQTPCHHLLPVNGKGKDSE